MLGFFAEISQVVIIGCCGFLLCIIVLMRDIAMKHKRASLKHERRASRSQRRSDALEDELAAAHAQIATLKSHGADLAQKVGWRPQRLMNRPEFRLFCTLESLMAQGGRGHRVFAQVSCGEFLEVAYRADLKAIAGDAWHCLNRKRVDFLIIDRGGMPIVAIEYHGEGHFQGNAQDRDHAKRVACQAAGIRFMEVAASGLTQGQQADLQALLSGNSASRTAAA